MLAQTSTPNGCTDTSRRKYLRSDHVAHLASGQTSLRRHQKRPWRMFGGRHLLRHAHRTSSERCLRGISKHLQMCQDHSTRQVDLRGGR